VPTSSSHPRSEAIVVLGCRVTRRGDPSLALRRRVELGLALYRQGAAPVLLLSGGGAGPVPEAEAMRALARDAGVPDEALVVEPGSHDTLENAFNAARLLRAIPVVLVSDATHLLRARLLFRLAGLAVAGTAGVPARSRRAGLAARLRELAALPWSLARALLRRAAAEPAR
jgi:uncharacterized SAM-binding protein YcdF (DUF218 family)